jgi:hypothetical protein
MLFVFSLSGVVSSAAIRSESVRVAIIKGAEEITIDGEGLLAADEKGEPIWFLRPQKSELTAKIIGDFSTFILQTKEYCW